MKVYIEKLVGISQAKAQPTKPASSTVEFDVCFVGRHLCRRFRWVNVVMCLDGLKSNLHRAGG
ncbi:hypothetical protein B5D82_01585 [Cognaticolwellia beringensis]|uniref:Uncharacterized protein n=1 Tax=Cognaticolwellia beringensis TaxID=1967665 RepID=A0A222G5F0_9GAMM|nr:hypothetical protein B5D82_01585 [Cognaticolwellia beringensis]